MEIYIYFNGILRITQKNNFSEIFFYLPNIFRDIQGKLGNFFNI